MKKIIVICAALFLCSTAFSQTNAPASNVLDGVYVKEHTATREIIPYAYLREADVMWNKRIWRVIDLKQKINLPLYYPYTGTHDRKSLMDVIWDAVKTEGSITAYADEEFTQRLTSEELEHVGGARVDTETIIDPNPPYLETRKPVVKEFEHSNVVALRLKEDWFFDKQRSVIDVRIIGMAPLMYDRDEAGNVREGASFKPVFWIYYPEARKTFVKSEAFNRANDAERRSFDDIFQKRMFSSFIMKESNVYDRRIDEYALGLGGLLESERIKTEIINFEHDMWEY